MKSILHHLSILLCLQATAHAATYTVSPNGHDSNPGTERQPFHTIGRAMKSLQPGDACLIKAGVYREAVALESSGAADAPIQLIGETHPDGSPAVILDGTEPITSPWKSARFNGRAVLWTPMREPVEQLFLDGIMMSEARWPDQPFSRIWDRETWAKSENGAEMDKMICAALAETGVDWTGAWATLNVGQQFQSWSRRVENHAKGSDTFTYTLAKRPNNDVTDGPTWWDDRFYLHGKIEALTAPGEWFHDAKSERLYFIPPDQNALASGAVSVKRRVFGLSGRNLEHVELSGLAFFGCTFEFQNCDHLLIENCRVLYPNYAPVLTDSLPKAQRKPIAQTAVSGNHNTLRRVGLAYGNTAGVSLRGNGNRLENSVIHDFCWAGNLNHPAVVIRSADQGPSDSVVTRCTVYNSGNMGIWFLNRGNEVSHNEVHDTGLACKDIAAIHTGSPQTAGSVVHHNWVHGSRGKGIRGDDQTRGLTFHHNVIWNCDEGMILKGEDNRCYNNTIIGSDGHGCLIIPTRPEPRKWWSKTEFLDQQNTRSVFRDNLVETLAYRHAPLPAKNVFDNVVTKDGDAFAKLLRDPANNDFRPRKSSLTAGAYDQNPWRPGADWKPKPIGVDFVVNTEVARAGHRETGSDKIVVRLPARLLESTLSDLSKSKLQTLYNDCWTEEEVVSRRELVQKRLSLTETDPERARLQKEIVVLHRTAGDRLKERAGEVISGSELTLFHSIR